MRQRIAVALCLASVVGIVWIAPALAASGDAAGTYTVMVTLIEISSDGGTSYTTVFSGSQSVNIASANAGAVAASLVNGVALAPATYNRLRVTIGANMLLKGYVNSGGTTYYTSGGTDAGGFTLNAGAANAPGSDYAISTFTIPSGSRTTTQTVSITVPAGGAAPTVRVAFDTTGVITISGGLPTVGAPAVTVTAA